MKPATHRGAAAVVFDERGRVLLVKWQAANGAYGPPGGRIEAGEEPHEAAVRETREETGVLATVVRLIGVYSFDGHGDAPHLVVYAFLCEAASGEPAVAAPDEIAEVGWFDPARLPAPLENVAPLAIADAVAGEYGVVRLGLPYAALE